MLHLNEQRDVIQAALAKLDEARHFSGPPNEFWPACLQALVAVVGADAAVMMMKGAEQDARWRKLAVWPNTNAAMLLIRSNEASVDQTASEAVVANGFVLELREPDAEGNHQFSVASPLDVAATSDACVAVLLVSAASMTEAQEALVRLALIANTPAIYQSRRVTDIAQSDVERIASVLELTTLLNGEERFMGAAMAFCNEIAARYQCDRVSLGALEHNTYVRVKAVSHTEKFERKMEAVQRLEAAMEEAVDQDEEVLWPSPKTSDFIARDHLAYAETQGVRYLCTIPLRVGGETVFAVTIERNAEPFTEQEVRVIQISTDAAARRLKDLKELDRWFGARFGAWCRRQVGKAVGVEHTWTKLLVILVCIGLGVLVFGRKTYRVEAPFAVVTDEMSYVPAPFEGYIEKVNTRVGRKVEAGEVLLTLDTRNLRLEESSAVSDMKRYMREVEKARSVRRLAEMKINEALVEQTRAKLDVIRLRLEQAAIAAPISGFVIEGELEEMAGAPVKQGDVLFKIVQVEDMYVELNVDEADVHEVVADMTGEIAFASRPNMKFPVEVTRIVPVAQTTQEGNYFLTQAHFTGAVEDWWRPGMTGVAKINIGSRNLLWIFTHRTIDRLRMWLWW